MDGFITLRETIIEQIIPLLDSDEVGAEDKFELMIQLARVRGTLDLYERAFRAVPKMEAESDKLRAYMDLLGDIDEEIQEKSNQVDTGNVQVREQDTEVSQASQNDSADATF